MATCRRVVFGAVLALAITSRASATPLQTCRHVIDRTGDWLVRDVNAIEAQCLARRAAGLLSAETMCIGDGDLNDSISDAGTQAAVDRAIRRASDEIAQHCSEENLLLLPPKGLGFSASPGDLDVIPFLIAQHLHASQTLMHARYPNETPIATCTGFSVLVTIEDRLREGVGGVVIALDYPSGVFIPGTGKDANVVAHLHFLSVNGLVTANDLGQGNDDNSQLNLAEVSLDDISGAFATVAFCLGAPEIPQLNTFACTVESASTPDGSPSPDITCSLSLPAL